MWARECVCMCARIRQPYAINMQGTFVSQVQTYTSHTCKQFCSRSSKQCKRSLLNSLPSTILRTPGTIALNSLLRVQVCLRLCILWSAGELPRLKFDYTECQKPTVSRWLFSNVHILARSQILWLLPQTIVLVVFVNERETKKRAFGKCKWKYFNKYVFHLFLQRYLIAYLINENEAWRSQTRWKENQANKLRRNVHTAMAREMIQFRGERLEFHIKLKLLI